MLDFTNLSSNLIIKLIPSFFLTIVLFNIFKQNKFSINYKLANYLYIIFFVFLISIGIFRDNHPEHKIQLIYFRFFNLILFSFVFLQTLTFTYSFKKNKIIDIFFYMIYLPILYLIIVNLVFYFVLGISIKNLEDTEIGYSLILQTLTGVSFTRIQFPFSNGFNNYGAIVGLLFMFSLLGWKFLNKNKFIFIIGVFSSFFTLLFIDTRTAIFFPILIFIFSIMFFKKNKKPRLLWTLPLLTIFGSNFLLIILGVLNTNFFQAFSRSNTDFATANGRVFIWPFSSLEFLKFKTIHLIGWGEYGHYKSGVSKNWEFIFQNWKNPELSTPHSTFYVILFDYGYLGLLFIFLLQFIVIKTIKAFWNSDKVTCIFIISFFVYWNLLGMTESFFGFYAHNIMYIFIGVLMITFLIRNKFNKYENKIKRVKF